MGRKRTLRSYAHLHSFTDRLSLAGEPISRMAAVVPARVSPQSAWRPRESFRPWVASRPAANVGGKPWRSQWVESGHSWLSCSRTMLCAAWNVSFGEENGTIYESRIP